MRASLTGSYSPIHGLQILSNQRTFEEQERLVQESIYATVQDQVDAGIDYLVDGQVRDDFVPIFIRHLPGFRRAPDLYEVYRRVEPSQNPITLSDYQCAKSFAPHKFFKGHLAGPFAIARSVRVTGEAPYTSRNDRQFILDLARAMGHEAKFLVENGAEIVQIDEPNLSDGVDLKLAFEAMELIVDIAGIPTPALHACSNITSIISQILERAPVKIISIEGAILDSPDLINVNRRYLSDCGKQLGIGCISVRGKQQSVENQQVLQITLDQYANRLGIENIWAAMPNCGMRRLNREIAKEKIKVLAQAAHEIY